MTAYKANQILDFCDRTQPDLVKKKIDREGHRFLALYDSTGESLGSLTVCTCCGSVSYTKSK